MKKSSHEGGSKFTASALAGILAVGMVPAAAFAEDVVDDTTDEAAIEEVAAEEAAEEVAIELEAEPEEEAPIELEAKATDAFTKGTIALAASAGTVTVASDGSVTVNPTAGGTAAGLTVATLKLVTDSAPSITVNSATSTTDYKITWYKVTDGSEQVVVAKDIKTAGSYKVTVEALTGSYKGATMTLSFAFGAASLADADAYAVDEDGEITTGQDFTYSGEAQQVAFSLDGGSTALVEGTDYSVEIYKLNTTTTVEPIAAGTYTAHLTGMGKYTGTKNINFTVDPFDLSTLTKKNENGEGGVYVADAYNVSASPSTNPTEPTTVNGSAAMAKDFQLTYDDAEVNAGAGVNGDYGAYTKVSVSLKAGASIAANYEDPTTKKIPDTVAKAIEFNKYASGAVFTYDGKAWPAEDDELVIDIDKNDTFNPALIAGTVNGKALKQVAASANDAPSKFAVTYAKADGTPVTDADTMVGTAGDYVVTATVGTDSTYAVGGSATMKVKVVNAVLDAESSLYLSYDGDPVDSDKVELSYLETKSGTAANFAGKLLNSDGADTGATLSFTFKDADGKDVADPTNVGTYTGTVKAATSDGIEILNNEFELVIKPVDVTEVIVENLDKLAINGQHALPLTAAGYGDLETAVTVAANAAGNDAAVDVALKYNIGDTDNDGEDEYMLLDGNTAPADEYDLTGAYEIVITYNGKEVEEIKDAGEYTIEVKAADVEDAANYNFTAPSITVKVAKGSTFVDVPEYNSDGTKNWRYEYAEAANTAGYFKGVGGTAYFAPNQGFKRGDACVVFYRMAKGAAAASDEGKSVEGVKYETGFSDVDPGSYYAQAIQWAANTGIVNGYGNGKFGPENTITRQEFATMLSRYANALAGESIAADEAELAKYPDGSKVASWAKPAISWASKKDIIGSNGTLAPGNNVTRAEAAKMCVVYQPAAL